MKRFKFFSIIAVLLAVLAPVISAQTAVTANSVVSTNAVDQGDYYEVTVTFKADSISKTTAFSDAFRVPPKYMANDFSINPIQWYMYTERGGYYTSTADTVGLCVYLYGVYGATADSAVIDTIFNTVPSSGTNAGVAWPLQTPKTGSLFIGADYQTGGAKNQQFAPTYKIGIFTKGVGSNEAYYDASSASNKVKLYFRKPQ